MPRLFNTHVEAEAGAELRQWGYRKVADAAALAALTDQVVGEIVTRTDTGRSYQWDGSQWDVWTRDGTVAREDISGVATFDVAGHEAAELQLTGATTALTLSGWNTDTSLYQKVRIEVRQDATGGHAFDWGSVSGTWLESPPDPLGVIPGDTILQFYAITTDGGATVWLEPIGIQYSMDCVYMQVVEVDVPAVTAGAFVTIGHSFQTVAHVDLIEVATGRRVLADWFQSPGSASGPVLIDFSGTHPVGTYTARVSGLASTPCDLTVSTEAWESMQLALTSATVGQLTLQHTGAPTDVQIVWGDGSTPVDVTSGASTSHTYGAAFTGPVTVRWRRGTSVTLLTSTSAGWSFDIESIAPSVQTIRFTSANTISGDLSSVSDDVVTLRVFGSNTLAGDVGVLPEGMVEFRAYGFTTVGGDITSIPTSLTDFVVRGNNTISGDIGALPTTGMVTFQVQGNNTISGDISSIPTTITDFLLVGSNTTTGDIGSLHAGLITYNNQGNNTAFGDIGSIPASITFWRNEGLNTATLATAYAPNAGLTDFYHRPAAGSGLPDTDVDSILAAIDALGTNNGDLTLDANNAAPTAAGVASAANLTGRGWTVLTN